MMSMEKLLDEVSRDMPCGEDFEARKAAKSREDNGELSPLEELQERIKPTTSGEKDWKSISTAASDVLKRSKDLRAVLILNLGMLKTGQLAGFKEGLTFLHALLEKYWDNLYPALKDGNPTRRVNVLNSFSFPAHQTNASFDFVRTLRQIPLARPARGASVSLNDIAASQKAPKEGEKATGPTAAAIQEAFTATDPAAIKQTHELLMGISSELDAIREFLAGKEASPNFSVLRDTLKEMTESVQEHIKSEPKTELSSEVHENGTEPVSSGGEAPVRRNGNGRVQSLDDVVTVLGEICKYYEVNDRSSPVPLLLKRVQRMAKMNFYEIMEDLTPEEIAKLKTVPKE
jgi:type VI secretion system protein ImpA